MAAWALSGVALFAVLVWWLNFPRSTPLVSAVLVEYGFPVPPNAWAWDDEKAIREQLSIDGAVAATKDEPLKFPEKWSVRWKDREAWLDALQDQVKDASYSRIQRWLTLGGGPGDGAIILYLSAHGVVDRDGRACFLLPRPAGDEGVSFDPRRDLVPVRELFDRLFYDRTNGTQKLAPEVTKLIVLDAGRIDQCWELGLLYNGFVESLQSELRELQVDNLFVLNSTDAGQKGWAAPELGASVFGFFVKRGLQGNADKEGFGNDDSFVSVEELSKYVRTNTAAWVRDNRDDRQQPLLLQAGKDAASSAGAPLLRYGSQLPGVADPTGSEAREARTARLDRIRGRLDRVRQSGWEHHARLAGRARQRQPLQWHAFQDHLLRAEQLAMAGEAPQYAAEQFNRELAQVETLRDSMSRVTTSDDLPNSLALAESLALTSHTRAEVEQLAKQLADGTATAESMRGKSYPVRAQAVWQALATNDSRMGDAQASSSGKAADAKILDRIETLLKAVEPTGGLAREFVEIHFLRMLGAPPGDNPYSPKDQRGYLNRFENKLPGLAAAVQNAIDRRAEAERRAAPTDERIHYWLRPLVDAGDKNRRLAEDLLFVGRQADLEQSQQASAKAAASYAKAKKISSALAAAYGVRDRAWAEIPYMLRFYARPLSVAAARDRANNDEQIRRLLILRESAQRLTSDFFAKVGVQGDFADEAVEELARNAGLLAVELDGAQAKYVGQLLQYRGGDAIDRRRVLDRFHAPLVFGGERALTAASDRKDLHAHLYKLCRDYDFPPTGVSQGAPVEERAAGLAPHLERMRKGKQHPAEALGPMMPAEKKEEVREPSATDLAIAGGDLRARVAALSSVISADAPPDLSRDDGFGAPGARTAVADADQKLRAAAGLFRLPLGRDSAPERLFRFDRQRLYVWHAQRAVDDFLGPRPDAEAPSFFSEAASHLLQLAKGLGGAAQPDDTMRKWVDARVLASEDALLPHFEETEIKIDPHNANHDTRDHSVAINRNPKLDLPSRGVAAFYLAERRGDVPGPQVQTRDTRLAYDVADPRAVAEESRRNYTMFGLRQQLERWPALRGVVFYRGHLFRDPKQIVRLVPYGCEREMEFDLPDYRPPTITVRGRKKPLAIMLILDCSGSMTPVALKMDPAKRAVRAILEELRTVAAEDRGELRVGLRLFAHRVGYKSPTSSVLEYRDPVKDAAVKVGTDVEAVAPVDPLALTQEKILAAVSDVKPRGNTPLYLAISQALDQDFDHTPADQYERQIVVITDGVNFQEKAGIAEKDLVRYRDLEAAIRADRNAARGKQEAESVAIQFIGFHYDEYLPGETKTNRYTDAQVRALNERFVVGSPKEMDALARASGGARYNADNEESLKQMLRQATGLFAYEVREGADGGATAMLSDGRGRASGLSLNRTYALNRREGQFLVRFQGVQNEKPVADYHFELRGRGERLVLRINHNTSNLERTERFLGQEHDLRSVEPYRLGDRAYQKAQFMEPWSRKNLRIMPIAPDPEGTGVRFRVALQYETTITDTPFTPQPVEALAIVQPEPKVPAFTVFDVSLEQARSVPTLSFKINDWQHKSGNARRAEIFLWLKFDKPTAPDDEVRLGTTNQYTFNRGAAPIDYKIELNRRAAEDVEIKVTETHREPAKTLDTVRLTVTDALDGSPRRIRRCYVTQNQGDTARTIEHVFYYPNEARLTQAKLQLTRIEQIKNGAMNLDKTPILVGIRK
ncbi:MAG: vWA domain-containing protein [Pirellulales bacterium]